MNQTLQRLRPWALALGAIALFAACNGDSNEDAILPVQARFDVNPPTADPAVFFVKGADANTTDDVVVVDVMLRATAGVTFSAFTMEIHFDPGTVQVGQVDLTTTPLGDCTTSSAIQCNENADSGAAPANDTGVLLIGVGAVNGGPTATLTGDQKLFTLRLVATTVGTSDITFTQGAGRGDCEILDAALADLGITCDSGSAQVVAAR